MKPMIKAGQAWHHGKIKGTTVHVVPDPYPGFQSGGPQFNPALCGAAPAGRSYGWIDAPVTMPVNCPKCLRRLAQEEEAQNA